MYTCWWDNYFHVKANSMFNIMQDIVKSSAIVKDGAPLIVTARDNGNGPVVVLNGRLYG